MIYPCQRWIQTAGKPTNIEKSASSILCDCSIRSDTFTYIISKRSIFRGFESTFLQASLPHLPQNSPGCTWQEAFLQWPQVSGGFWKKTEKSMGFLIKDRDDPLDFPSHPLIFRSTESIDPGWWITAWAGCKIQGQPGSPAVGWHRNTSCWLHLLPAPQEGRRPLRNVVVASANGQWVMIQVKVLPL